MHPNGEVNLIVIDIADNLEADLKRDITAKFKCQPNIKRIHFYKANLADAPSIELLWQKIVSDHGPIHILINNAARCLGRRVDELTL
jgi:NAD(P)-dependent dehydrogenase (short-subunit alcohol dehydrogenase family)